MNDITKSTDEQNHDVTSVKKPIAEHPISYVMRFLYEIAKTVIGVLIIALIIRAYFIEPFVVDGSSMEPTLHNYEYLLVEKTGLLYSHPSRGDIIVFKYPLNTSVNYVKRVIGLPGDTVVIAKGKVTIYNSNHPKGEVLSEKYLTPGQQTTVDGSYAPQSWTVGPNNYFVMGDNRDHSDDSRDWNLVPASDLIGRAFLTVYRTDNLGILQHITYSS